MRSRVQFHVHFEKPSRYFLATESKRAQLKTIKSLVTSKGLSVSSISDILKECESFYGALFNEEPIDPVSAASFLAAVPSLPAGLAESLEAPISKEECLSAISRMKDNKSPGLDGLTKEFYLKVFDIIGDHFLLILNLIFQNQLLSPSQRHGLITLICKNPDASESLKNWRPISLLNVDYKIISKVLSIRLSAVLSAIINIDQTCSVPGRSILDNGHLMRNICDYAVQKRLNVAILSLDQAKAFDRVSFEYLWRSLQAFGFGPVFSQWIRILYTDISSSIIVNGHFSKPFSLCRGVRQGCSLSPMLYVLYIESLAIAIRRHSSIHGLPLPGGRGEVRISQYADDTTCIVSDSLSVKAVFEVCSDFSRASGALLNHDKTQGLMIGHFPIHWDCPVHWSPAVKICGIWYGRDSVSLNWDAVATKMATAAKLHSLRHLTLRGRALIANVLLCSKVWYVGSVVPAGDDILGRLRRILFTFVWGSEVVKVNRDTLMLPLSKGGLNIVHVGDKLRAFRVRHILSLINNDFVKWHPFGIYWLGFALSRFNRSFASNLLPHSATRPTFYDLCFSAFRAFESALLDGLQPALHATVKQPRRDYPASEISKSRSTKECYAILRSGFHCTPLVMSKHPAIDFSSAFRINCLDYLDPFDRNLAWRLLHGILPVRARLHQLGICKNPSCPHCGDGSFEDLAHAFCLCPLVQPLWTFLHMVFLSLGFPRDSFLLSLGSPSLAKQILFNSIHARNSVGAKACLILIYALRSTIWAVRNEALHERKRFLSRSVEKRFFGVVRQRIVTDFQVLKVEAFNELWGLNSKFVWVRDGKLWVAEWPP